MIVWWKGLEKENTQESIVISTRLSQQDTLIIMISP